MRRIVRLALALLPLAVSAPALAGDFVDTRINFTITDENMLVKPGETNPSIPGVHIGQPNSFGILFFDNYDTRYTGYENLTHLTLYKKVTGQNFEAEGAIVLRFLEFSDVSLSSFDDGSYIKITYFPDKSRESKSNLSLTAFPISADRMRLGYSYRLSWGGSPMFFKFNPDLPTSAQVPVNTNPAPGARLQWASDQFVAWAGFKASLLLNRNPQVNEQVAVWAGMGGLSWDAIRNHLRLEVNGGYFDRGTNPLFYSTQDLSGQTTPTYQDFPVTTAGASFQISVFNGVSPSGSLDLQLYKNDPTSAQRYFAKFDYMPGFHWLAQSEFTVMGSTLQNPDKVSTTDVQMGYAADLNLRAQSGHTRLRLDVSYRSLAFMLVNQPSLVPYQDFPAGSDVGFDLFAAAGVDYNFERWGLTAGLTVGVDSPATFKPPSVQAGQGYCPSTGGATCTASTIVVRAEGDYSILPETDSMGGKVTALPIEALKMMLREDFLDYFALILYVYYSHDPNQTHLTKVYDPGTGLYNEKRDFNHPDQLGFNLTMQARF